MMNGRWEVAVVASIALATGTSGAIGDELKFESQPPFKRVQVLGLQFGQVRFRLGSPGGRILNKSLADLEQLRIEGATDLNRAEQYVARKEDLKAIAAYERALKRTNEAWRKTLILARMLPACDRAGRFDLAVEAYVALLERAGGGVASLRPRNLPGPESRYYVVALDRLDAGLKTATDELTRKALEAVKKEILDEVGDPRAPQAPAVGPSATGATPRPSRPTAPAARRGTAARLRVIEEQLAKGHFAQAEATLRTLQPNVSLARLPTVLRMRAQVAHAKDAWLEAALWAMRVVIQFPKSAEAAECLYIAAVAHEQIGRADIAATLLTECKRHAAVTPALAGRADEAMARLSME